LPYWEDELATDYDKDFILHGIRFGFSLVDCPPHNVPSAYLDNHPSACAQDCRHLVEARIKDEIIDGNYIVLPDSPTLVSPLAVVPKPNGDIRLIHDLSRPQNNSLNDFASKDECRYVTVEQALQNCSPGSFLCTLDLQWAYRSIPIKPEERTLTGLSWQFDQGSTTYLADCRLPFGARKSPAIFNRITQSIQRMMIKRGFNVSCYLDDFLIHEPTKEKCQTALNTLISLLRKLGLRINWRKVCDPCQCLTFLGVQIDTIKGTLRLDPSKASDLKSHIEDLLTKTRITKKQLQSLGGRLNWAANVHPWGRPYMDSTYRAISCLQKPQHKFRIAKDFTEDLAWWLTRLNDDNHVRLLWDSRPGICLYTDSSTVGGGAFCHGDWMYINWIIDRPQLASCHINLKELAMAVEAAARWAPHYQAYHLDIFTDNMVTFYALNNKRSKNRLAALLLKQLATIAATYNVTIQGHYIKGECNDMADCISRLQSPGQSQRLLSLLTAASTTCLLPAWYYLPAHMSAGSHCFLLPSLQKAWTSWLSWMMK
jgi:hypothetical protein